MHIISNTPLMLRDKHYRLYVMLDCWSAHITKKLPELLNGQAIELVYLPTNASWMIDVERVFQITSRWNIQRNPIFMSRYR